MTYQEAYQKATGELKAAGIPEPESDAWILLEHVTGMTRTRYYVDGFERMPKNEEDRFFELQKNPDSGAASDRGSGIYGI